MKSSVHVDNRKKDILVLDKGPTQELHNTTLTAEKKYAIYFSEQQRKYCLNLYYDRIEWPYIC